MTRRCKCGGRVARIDIVTQHMRDPRTGETRLMFVDVDPMHAHFACVECGKTARQRKRRGRTR